MSEEQYRPESEPTTHTLFSQIRGEFNAPMACSIKYFGGAAVGENVGAEWLFTYMAPFGPNRKEADHKYTLIQQYASSLICNAQ